MATSSKALLQHPIARQVREQFVNALDAAIIELVSLIQRHLDGLAQGGVGSRAVAEIQLAMEAAASFQTQRQAWAVGVRREWREAFILMGGKTGHADIGGGLSLSLVDDELVERKIAASRLATAVGEAAGEEFNALRLRIQFLERSTELQPGDVLKPEVLAQVLIKVWTDCGLTRPMWALAQPAVQEGLGRRMPEAYRQANETLVQRGVMAEIDLKSMVRRTDDGATSPGDLGGEVPARTPQAPAARGHDRNPRGLAEDPRSAAARGYADGPHGFAGAPRNFADDPRFGRPAGPVRGVPTSRADGPMTSSMGGTAFSGVPDVRHSALARADQETRMLTAASPLSRVRQRAQGVLGQLRRLLSDHVTEFAAGAPPGPPSPPLAKALAEAGTQFAVTELMESSDGGATRTLPMASVEVVATKLRQRATELKEKAEKPSEKAIIEIVALMFQAILAEERIPAAIRVWFARLQIPVLRLALAEPDFFASVQHPARQLIDRMGACALGFDASTITGSRLEREIKRIVQVVEQYPETGRRVYQLVLDEFKKFLGRSLTEGGSAQQAATLAQQVEQKEALAIQYTIELRRMLASLPVPEEVREFLFRIWSDVLAMAAVRWGPQAEETLRYKQAAADLLWAVSPKMERAERSRVVQQLSGLLHTLREGMSTLAIADDEQDGNIKLVSDAVMQAFVSRGEGLSSSKLAELSRGLAALEDVVTDDPEGDVLLDPGVIELMFGVESDALEVIATGGSMPSSGMLQWANELELGVWFALDHQGDAVQVQYVWRSRRGQLHLFSAGAGRNYLVQTRRLASYLQAGLLVPVEDETLTIRATREALAKLNAAPGQLLH